jgi:plasmid stabilization system protein ParE
MAEMRRIEWSLEARSNLDNIITYLENEWTEKEVRNFSERLEKQLSLLLQTPEVYKKSLRKEGLRECQVTNHNTLFYTYDDEKLYIVTIFDNRQDPQKLNP